ncbi:bifunctional folylpolyglutamate synthase/dihydrofolate synthase [Prochlorococcus sp. MIT 1307]|uniref:bifunctional folylpolyglutamate synthase/dihydrofolate synthase n=1 Tax=Prochlorococcus sp. MIT 1307 TaxID=3096219 RepID=UPI002A74FADB|nr:cyanophycin synthetase [Prochlorococcus sp. MIT 1307]
MEHKTISNFEELTDLIPSFDQRGMDLGIERIKKALQLMGNPCSEIPAIQIAGTNGKGSIASFIQSCLKAARIKSGTTTSPHLVSWCERIRIDDNLISLQEFRQILLSLRPLLKVHQLTPFELVMAVAFEYFAKHNVQLLVLEVGLGGRLDATTAHPLRPVIAMGSIGLDHCDHLGATIKDIAQEKAAVITSGCKVISAAQHPDVTQVLKDTAEKHNAQIQWVPPIPQSWELGISGDIQRKNAAVAKGALQSLGKLGWELDEPLIRKGLALANWPGRLQRTNWNGFPVVIDGAHNPHAAKELAKERSKWAQEEIGVHWVLGIQRHKQAPEMLRYLIKPQDIAWVIPIPNHDSWSQVQLSNACPELTSQLLQANQVEQVFSKIQKKGRWPTPPPVVAGSLYLIGDTFKRKILNNTIP